MTKSIATMEVNQFESKAANNRLASVEFSESGNPRHRRVSREQYIGLLLSHNRLRRCDDHAMGVRGLRDPKTGDFFFINEEELFEILAD